MDVMKWDVLVPACNIDVRAQDGWVTLSGNVYRYYEKNTTEDNLRKLSGVRGSATVSGKIGVPSQASIPTKT